MCFRTLAGVRGSLLMTAVFVLVVFSGIAAVLAQILIQDRQVQLNAVLGSQARLMAESGLEYGMSSLFPLNRESSYAESPSASRVWQTIKNDIKTSGHASYDFIASEGGVFGNCSKEASGSNTYFCKDLYSQCWLSRLTVEAVDLAFLNDGSSPVSLDSRIEYTIVSEASCEIPILDDDNSSSADTYVITRKAEITAADLRYSGSAISN